jgi:peptidoglycan/xylan/chitin deacetylase (PgdA/CDA1 family)
MTSVYITIDTEYSADLYRRRPSSDRTENFNRSILGVTAEHDVGIKYQLDAFDHYGLKAVFFVDPMPALVWGTEAITDIVGPIVERGHDVQLHVHSEWLDFAGDQNPVGGHTGKNIKDFNFDEQCILLDYAMRTLISAGAPRPTAFRAGNYGANDDTLRALAQIGIRYDTSHCPGISKSDCEISLSEVVRAPIEHCGVIEVPIGCIESYGGTLRHAQLTALSDAEISAAIRFAHANNAGSFSLVSHSFELLSRDRSRINHIIKHRFHRMCAALAKMPGVQTATYATNPPKVSIANTVMPVLPHNFWRTGIRMGEQVLGNALYGSK